VGATGKEGRAIAQAVSRRLPTAAARVQNSGLVMWDFVMDKSGVGAGFLRELRFPLPIYIPSDFPQSSSLSPEAGTIGQEWPQCQLPHKPNNNKKKTEYNIMLKYNTMNSKCNLVIFECIFLTL
jgi:hypothetical protein